MTRLEMKERISGVQWLSGTIEQGGATMCMVLRRRRKVSLHYTHEDTQVLKVCCNVHYMTLQEITIHMAVLLFLRTVGGLQLFQNFNEKKIKN